jgi:hypothetical protein
MPPGFLAMGDAMNIRPRMVARPVGSDWPGDRSDALPHLAAAVQRFGSLTSEPARSRRTFH